MAKQQVRVSDAITVAHGIDMNCGSSMQMTVATANIDLEEEVLKLKKLNADLQEKVGIYCCLERIRSSSD